MYRSRSFDSSLWSSGHYSEQICDEFEPKIASLRCVVVVRIFKGWQIEGILGGDGGGQSNPSRCMDRDVLRLS